MFFFFLNLTHPNFKPIEHPFLLNIPINPGIISWDKQPLILSLKKKYVSTNLIMETNKKVARCELLKHRLDLNVCVKQIENRLNSKRIC